MKKLFYLFGVMLLTATVFTSCSDDEVGNAKDLIGQWQGVSEEGWEKVNGKVVDDWSNDYDDVMYVFTEDGKLSLYEYSSGRWRLEEQVEYRYKNGKISISGSDEVADVKKLTSNTLILVFRFEENYEGDRYEGYDEYTFRRADDIEL